MNQKTAIIIGAGPAGLTAALELLRNTQVRPILLEASNTVGGISRTIEFKGNRMDIGGHRFFSRSDWVMNWWQEILPIEPTAEDAIEISYQNKQRRVEVRSTTRADEDKVMLVRSRLSRIYFLRNFFSYPIELSVDTMRKLGAWRLCKIGFTYMHACIFPRRPEKNLEDFIINRFGKELYSTFFRDYTEKVWGVPCDRISPEWGAQRIKGLSVWKAIGHALKQGRKRQSKSKDFRQKETEPSLIEQFLYPKFGPGQMWSEVAKEVERLGGEIQYKSEVTGVTHEHGQVASVRVRRDSGAIDTISGDFVLSSMPVRNLIAGMNDVPEEVRRVADGLQYRDFITVGVLLRKMKNSSDHSSSRHILPDNWIYIQEKDVKLGRVQIFNNWSPSLVADQNTVWLGLEYFCTEDDELWRLTDEQLKQLAVEELAKIGLINPSDVLDSHVERVEKAYPAYFGTYGEFAVIREFTDNIPNLFLMGRNGMHRYNNQDHSMLTARDAVRCIQHGKTEKDHIWAINLDDEYHEEK
jgi:protoporphyrinogen oxidase